MPLFLIVARTWSVLSVNLDVLAIRHFRKENSAFTLGIEVFLLLEHGLMVVLAGAWVVFAWEVVRDQLIGLKNITWDLAAHEVSCSQSVFHLFFFWIIAGRTNSVIAKTTVSYLGYFLGWY